MGVKLSSISNLVLADIVANNAIEITSSSGMGKSEWSMQLLEHLKSTIWKGLSVGYQTLFLATKNPMDLMGITFKGNSTYMNADGEPVKYTITDPAIPEWFVSKGDRRPAWEYDRFLLIFDEYGQGGEDVLKMSSEIMLHGELGKWKLPPGSARIALSNEGTGYGVGKRFHFITNRMKRYWLDPDPEGWLEYTSRPYLFDGEEYNTLPVTRAFGKAHPLDCLYETTPKIPGTPWCTPRSLLMVDRWLQQYMAIIGPDFSIDDPSLIYGLQSGIGVAAGSVYHAFLKYQLEMPTYESIVADPVKMPVPEKIDHQMILVYQLAAFAKRKDYSALITYIKRMSRDMALSFCKTVLSSDPAFITHPDYKTWALSNAGLMAMMKV